MSRWLVVVAGAVGLLVLASAGAYVYYFSGARSAPPSLAQASPSPATGPATSAGAGSLPGKWTVASGSQAEYRVKEQFAGQTSQHEAVARTSSVGGGFTVTSAAGGYQVGGVQFAAQLAELHSVDTVAGFNVTQRDRIVQGALDVSRFPTAGFSADTVTVPAGVTDGQPVSLSVPGKLTIHGVTRDATIAVTAQVRGDKIDLTGSTNQNMTDFGITPPHVSITVVQPAVTIDFALTLTKA